MDLLKINNVNTENIPSTLNGVTNEELDNDIHGNSIHLLDDMEAYAIHESIPDIFEDFDNQSLLSSLINQNHYEAHP